MDIFERETCTTFGSLFSLHIFIPSEYQGKQQISARSTEGFKKKEGLMFLFLMVFMKVLSILANIFGSHSQMEIGI